MCPNVNGVCPHVYQCVSPNVYVVCPKVRKFLIFIFKLYPGGVFSSTTDDACQSTTAPPAGPS